MCLFVCSSLSFVICVLRDKDANRFKDIIDQNIKSKIDIIGSVHAKFQRFFTI